MLALLAAVAAAAFFLVALIVNATTHGTEFWTLLGLLALALTAVATHTPAGRWTNHRTD